MDNQGPVDRALAALKELQTLPGTATGKPGSSEVPLPAAQEAEGVASGASAVPLPDAPPAATTKGEDDPVTIRARREIQSALERILIPETVPIVRAWAKEQGVSFGIDEATLEPRLQKGGEELPIDEASLRRLVLGAAIENFMPAKGRPGSGIVEPGRVPQQPEDIVDRGLRDQAFFEKNQEAILREIQRRRG